MHWESGQQEELVYGIFRDEMFFSVNASLDGKARANSCGLEYVD